MFTSLYNVVHKTGTYVNMEGPAFSTVAESNLHRSWGGSVIGMTAVAEAKLCREAEISYVALKPATVLPLVLFVLCMCMCVCVCVHDVMFACSSRYAMH